MNPLGGGLIPQNPQRFSFIRTRDDENVVEAGLRFLINDPRITTALVGLSDENQLHEAIKAVDEFEPIAPEKIDNIKSNLENIFNELCTGCRYCDNCPQGIPIPKLLDAYNHYLLTNEEKQLYNRLKWHWSISPQDVFDMECIECGECEENCTQKLNIIERITHTKSILKNIKE